MALALVVLLGCGALALDIAHVVSVKRELTRAAEAGALSGARGLWPQNMLIAASRDPDCSVAAFLARTTAVKNPVDGVALSPEEVAVEVGRWDYAANLFTPGISVDANSVRVTASRANVQFSFARIFGQNSQDMSATAIAVMDFAGSLGQGTLPIAVNQDYAKWPGKTIYIGFNPDPEDNGGWFVKAPDSASASTLKDYIDNAACPPLNIGDTIYLENGIDASVLQTLSSAMESHPEGWIVLLPVVDTPKFNHEDQIDNFVPVKITEVKKTADPKYVKGTVMTMGEAASAMPGGGGKYGALAPPKLVR